MSSLGENIKLLCEVNGVTMRELSEKADLCVETIRDIIRGKTTPHMSTVYRIATAFGITEEELTGEEEWQKEIGDDISPIGKTIDELRKGKRMTRNALIEKAGICRKTFFNIMKAKTKISFATLKRIAKALDVTPEDLRKNEQAKNYEYGSKMTNIGRICKKRKMTFEELSQISGVSTNAIRKIGNDKVKTRESTIRAVANALGVPEVELTA